MRIGVESHILPEWYVRHLGDCGDGWEHDGSRGWLGAMSVV